VWATSIGHVSIMSNSTRQESRKTAGPRDAVSVERILTLHEIVAVREFITKNRGYRTSLGSAVLNANARLGKLLRTSQADNIKFACGRAHRLDLHSYRQ